MSFLDKIIAIGGASGFGGAWLWSNRIGGEFVAAVMVMLGMLLFGALAWRADLWRPRKTPVTLQRGVRALPSPSRRTVGTVGLVVLILVSPIAYIVPLAQVSAAATGGGTVLADHETGDLSAYGSTNTDFSVTSNEPIEGDYSLNYASSGATSSYATKSISSASPSQFSFYANTSKISGGGSHLYGGLSNSDTRIISFGPGMGSELEVLYDGGSFREETNITLQKNTTYRFVAENIDWSAETYDIVVYDTDGNEVGSYTGGTFHNSASSVNQLQWTGRSYNGQIDVDADYAGINGITPVNPTGVTIDGTVTNQNGTAVSNATVVAGHNNSVVGTTNASGYYNFTAPYNGGEGANITAYKAGYAASSTVQVSSDGAQNLSLGSEKSNFSTGKVLTGYQEPAPGAKVQVRDPASGVILETTYADANGEYALETTGDVEVEGSKVGRFDDEVTPSLPGAIKPLYLTEDTPAREGYDADVTDPIIGGDLDSLNTSSLSSECDVLFGNEPELEAGLNILTGGYSGAADALGLVEIGPDSCVPSTQEQERLALLVGAATTNQSEQNTQAVLGNYLTDARQTAYSEGKLAAWNAIANNATVEQTKIEANTSAEGYYHSMQDNLASVYATSVSNAEYTYTREYNQTDATGEWVYPVYDNGTEASFAANPWVTAEIDLPMGTVEMRTYRLADGSVVTPYPNATSVPGGGPYVAGPKLHVEGPTNSSDTLSGGAYTVIADSGKFEATNTEISDQRQQVKDNLAVFIDGQYANVSAEEINASDVLSPAQIASRASTDYDSTGYYGFAAAELAAQGKAGNLSMSHNLSLADGSEVEGTLFYTGNSENLTLTRGEKYDPANYSGTFILAANADAGGIQELTSPFVIQEQRNTKTGEVVNTTSVERYTYNTTSTGNFSADIQRLEELAAAYEAQQVPASGGTGCLAACGEGSSLLPKETVIGAAFGILVVLLVANRS